MIPKSESASHVQIVREQVGESLRVLPLIETARGLWNALETARAPGVERLIFGSIDFELDLGMQAEPEELSAFQCQLVLVSRVAGIGPPVDGITPAINDMERLRADALRARRLGFSGKLCIHPRQVACVRECFEPSAAEIAWAKRVVEAASAACGAAVAVDGRMVDRPAVLRAEQILAKLS